MLIPPHRGDLDQFPSYVPEKDFLRTLESQPDVPTPLPVPTSMFLAIAMAANALIFPKTLNSSWT